MPESNESPVRARRVSMTVTGYLRGGHPIGGYYDLQTDANGGLTYSIPEFEVDEASVRDAPPETLSTDDWGGIRAMVAARYGAEAGARLIAKWMRCAEAMDAERGVR